MTFEREFHKGRRLGEGRNSLSRTPERELAITGQEEDLENGLKKKSMAEEIYNGSSAKMDICWSFSHSES